MEPVSRLSSNSIGSTWKNYDGACIGSICLLIQTYGKCLLIIPHWYVTFSKFHELFLSLLLSRGQNAPLRIFVWSISIEISAIHFFKFNESNFIYKLCNSMNIVIFIELRYMYSIPSVFSVFLNKCTTRNFILTPGSKVIRDNFFSFKCVLLNEVVRAENWKLCTSVVLRFLANPTKDSYR